MTQEELNEVIKDNLIEIAKNTDLETIMSEYCYNNTFYDVSDVDLDALEEFIQDKVWQDSEIIYYNEAWEILGKDGNFEEACQLAHGVGYTLKNIDVYVLASLVMQDELQDCYFSAYHDIKEDIENFLEELEEEIIENDEETES